MLRRCTERRESGDGRLERAAQLEQLADEAIARNDRELPGENIRVEQIQLSAARTRVPVFGRELQQSLADENLGGLAQHRAADAELFAPVGLVGQGLSLRELATDDAKPDGVDHASRQPPARARRRVEPMHLGPRQGDAPRLALIRKGG